MQTEYHIYLIIIEAETRICTWLLQNSSAEISAYIMTN